MALRLRAQVSNIDVSVRLAVVFNLHEREGLAVSLSFAQSQSAEGFPDLAVTSRAMDRNERADWMGAELLRKGDFFLRREARA